MANEKLMEALKKVVDPELGVSIVDLGFIYEAKVGGADGRKAHVKMTLSTPMCPLSSLIVGDVEQKVKEAGFEPDIEVVFEPAWTPDMMSDELKQKLTSIRKNEK